MLWDSYSPMDGLWAWTHDGTLPTWMTYDAIAALRVAQVGHLGHERVIHEVAVLVNPGIPAALADHSRRGDCITNKIPHCALSASCGNQFSRSAWLLSGKATWRILIMAY